MRLQKRELFSLEGSHRQAELICFVSYLFLKMVHFVSGPCIENVEYVAIVLLSEAALHAVAQIALRLVNG